MTYQVADPGDNYVDEHGALLTTQYIHDDDVPVSMDYTHHLIHEDNLFTVSNYWTALADAGSAMLSGTIPAGMTPHTIWATNVGGNCKMEIIEGGTITGGTMVTAYNRNRNAATASMGSVAYHSGTLTGGTVVYIAHVPGGTKNFGAGAGTRGSSEWVFFPGKWTTFRITNVSGGAINLSLQANFYDKATD